MSNTNMNFGMNQNGMPNMGMSPMGQPYNPYGWTMSPDLQQSYGAHYDYLMNFCGYFKIYFHALGAVSLILFALLVYLIQFVSPKELSKKVKFTLINTVMMNFFVVLAYWLWQPIPLFPYLGGFAIGILKFIGKEGEMIGMHLWAITITGLILAIILCQTSKVVLFQPPGPITNFLSETKNLVATYIGLFLINAVVSIATLRLALTVPPDLKTGLDPTRDRDGGSYGMFMMLASKNEESAMTFSVDHNGWAYAYVIWFLLVIAAGLIGIFLLNYRLCSSVCETRALVSDKTYQMQKQLSRTLLACSIIFIIFLFVPILITLLCILNVIQSMYVGIIAFSYIPLYSPVLNLLIIFNVKPYRRFVFRVVKVKILRGSSVSESTDVSPIVKGSNSGGDTTKTASERTGSATRTTRIDITMASSERRESMKM